MTHPQPSDHARELVRGAVDLHVHAGPDIVPRRADADDILRGFTEQGLAGFVDKNHFLPTALKGVHGVDGGAQHFSSIVLNNFVGGLNPLAVEVAARAGASVVWLPTVDVEMTPGAAHQPHAGTPSSWSKVRDEIMERGLNAPMAPILDDGRSSPHLMGVLEVIRDHDLALATGHLGFTETLGAVQAASEMGIDRVIVTHPEFPSQQFTSSQKQALVEAGGTLEYCYTTASTGKNVLGTVVERDPVGPRGQRGHQQ